MGGDYQECGDRALRYTTGRGVNWHCISEGQWQQLPKLKDPRALDPEMF